MAENTKESKKTIDPLDELVPYRAFKDNDKYKDDLSFTVAGKLWRIKRGEDVMIPRYVYNVIMDSENRALEAAKRAEAMQDAYKKSSKNFE